LVTKWKKTIWDVQGKGTAEQSRCDRLFIWRESRRRIFIKFNEACFYINTGYRLQESCLTERNEMLQLAVGTVVWTAD